MADLIPSNSGDPDPDRDERDPRVIGLDSDEADDLLGAVSSSTARSVLAALHEAPATPSELATEVDTSLQNVQYHLGNLSEAGLVEVADTRYSEKGREMNVYTPADRALVVVAGRDEETRGLKSALARLIGGVGVLGIGAAVVNRLARTGSVLPFVAGGGADSGGDVSVSYTGDAGGVNATTAEGAGAAAGHTTTAVDGTRTAAETATQTADGGGVGIAEVTSTAATKTAGATRTATPEATRTVTEAATQTPAHAATSTPVPTEEPATTVLHTATETGAQFAAGSPGVAGVIDSLSPGAMFFLGGLTVLVAWVAVGVLRD